MNVQTMIHLAWRTVREIAGSTAVLRAAVLVLPFAGVLVGMDVAARYGDMTQARLPDALFLSSEGGLGELYEYVLTSATALLLWLAWRQTRSVAYLANALLFIWLTLDNSIEIHENGGDVIAPLFTGLDAIPVPADQIGEMVFLLLVGGVWGLSLLICLLRSEIVPVLHALILVGCIATMAAFGILADFVDSWGTHSRLQAEIGNFIEDGGEFVMIIACLLVAAGVFDAVRKSGVDYPDSA